MANMQQRRRGALPLSGIAGVAQLAAHLSCKQVVPGSSPGVGSTTPQVRMCFALGGACCLGYDLPTDSPTSGSWSVVQATPRRLNARVGTSWTLWDAMSSWHPFHDPGAGWAGSGSLGCGPCDSSSHVRPTSIPVPLGGRPRCWLASRGHHSITSWCPASVVHCRSCRRLSNIAHASPSREMGDRLVDRAEQVVGS